MMPTIAASGCSESRHHLRRATQAITNRILHEVATAPKQAAVAAEISKPPQSITFEQLLYKYCQARSISDSTAYLYRRQLIDAGYPGLAVDSVTDEMIDAMEHKTAIVIVQSLYIFSRMSP